MRSGFTGEILHFGAARLRLKGNGVFRSTLKSLDDVVTSPLPNITLLAANNREPTILSNFNQQKAYFRGETTGFGESFTISRIIIYVREAASGYPTE